ncbi:MAG: hypothetical protein VKL01_04965 [Limnothrix sp.]|nr:hypothetical protein [Limnothrix sp.]
MNALGLLVGLALYQGLVIANRYSLPINNVAHLVFPQQTSWTILGASVVYLAVVYLLLSIAQQRYKNRYQEVAERVTESRGDRVESLGLSDGHDLATRRF